MFWTRIQKLFYLLVHPELFLLFVRYRVIPAIEHKKALDRRLRSIVDVGANRGQFALAAMIFTDAKVYSFEPLPEPAATYRDIFDKYPDFTLYPVGVSEEEGALDIHVSKSDDSSSFLRIGEGQSRIFPGTEESGTLLVKTAPLSRSLDQTSIVSPSMLKLDVQGYELTVLRSAGEMLSDFDYIYCECSFIELYIGQALCTEIIVYLSEREFSLIGVYNLYLDKKGRAVQADFLFKKESV